MISALRRHPVPLVLTAATGLFAFRLARAARGVPTSMGASRRRIAPSALASAQFSGGAFLNRLPSTTIASGSTPGLIRGLLSHKDRGKPAGSVPLVTPEFPAEAADLAVTWLGHASALIEIDGRRILADPVFEERVSPSTRLGPRRMHDNPLRPDRLPALTAVIISHDHYDHLELPTVRALLRQRAPFVVPVGIGAHLRGWGVPADRIIELDWDGSVTLDGITLTCTEARHFSGRGLKRNTTLWSSWALTGPQHRVYFGGDTGYTPAFAEIGARLGPFDLTLLPIGAYNDAWPDIHMNPEEAWRAHGDLGGRVLLPIHWATFDLALHTWSEPVERLLAAAGGSGVIALPRPGERLVADRPPADPDWWRPLARTTTGA